MAPRNKKKSLHIVEKERRKKNNENTDLWLYGHHAVKAALLNSKREKIKLLITPNALKKLDKEVSTSGIKPTLVDPRIFKAPIDPSAVHQGIALQTQPLNWASVSETCHPKTGREMVLMLDRLSDPHNVGAILRSAHVFGAQAVIATKRHAAPETGALAKTASGALEKVPYLQIGNLANAIKTLKQNGYFVCGLDGQGHETLPKFLDGFGSHPIAFILGAEGPGMRELTLKLCDVICKVPFETDFGSLNVSNAAAISLYAGRQALGSV